MRLERATAWPGLVLALVVWCGGWRAGEPATARQADRVTVSGAWVRESLPGRPATSGYLTLANRGSAPARLVGGLTKAARVVELHEMRTDGDTMKMRRIEGIDLPAGGKVDLRPGGLHLMLIGLEAPLRRGETVALALRFSDGSALDVDFDIRPLEHMPH
jgi:periplasmic copper chaperone A